MKTSENMDSNDELVDIVDENNQVIGKAAKQETHQKGLLHRTVIAEVIDSQGKFLLVKQASHKQDPEKYVSPCGGHIQSGESEVEALKREILEELGIKNFRYSYKGKVISNIPVREHIENHYFIVYEIFSDAEPVLNDESVSFERFTKEELKKKIKEHPQHFGRAFWPVFKSFYPKLTE